MDAWPTLARVLKLPPPVTVADAPSILSELRRAQGWSMSEAADALGLEGEHGARRIREYELGDKPAPGMLRLILALLART